MPKKTFDVKSVLVQAMEWHHHGQNELNTLQNEHGSNIHWYLHKALAHASLLIITGTFVPAFYGFTYISWKYYVSDLLYQFYAHG